MSIQITGGAAGLPTTGGTLTGPLAIAVGSAAAPGLAVAGDANTGLWAPAADVLAVATGGVERLRVASNGRVGIGATEPTANLSVVNGAYTDPAGAAGDVMHLVGDAAAIRFVDTISTWQSGISSENGKLRLSSGAEDIVFATNITANTALYNAGTARMTIQQSTGNVGIGTTGPTAALHVPASTTARASLRIPDGTAPTAPNAGDVWAAGGKLYFYDGATTKEIAFV